MTISASGWLGLLQIVSKPDTASTRRQSLEGVDLRGCASKDAGPEGGGL